MDTFGRDARDLPASEDARRSGEWGAGPFETPAVILDWHYASSPFCAEMQRERIGLLGTAAPSEWVGADVSPYGSHPSTALLEAANDNARLWVVR